MTWSEGGTTDISSRWFDDGDPVSIHATADAYYTFAGWQGDTNDAVLSGPDLDAVMNYPRTLTTRFSPNLTSLGVPEAWLAEYGWTNNFEAVSLLDEDGDSHPTWMEYFADTNPTNDQSVLRILSISPNGLQVVLEYQGGEDAWQVIEFNENLSSPEGWAPVFTNAPPTSMLNSILVPISPSNAPGSYRIRVHR